MVLCLNSNANIQIYFQKENKISQIIIIYYPVIFQEEIIIFTYNNYFVPLLSKFTNKNMKHHLLLLILAYIYIPSWGQNQSIYYNSYKEKNEDTNYFNTNIPKREVRAVWLTTIGGLDWPHSYSQSERSAQKQKTELCHLLDLYQQAGINTILIQTRVRGTMIYPSAYEPWDGCLSGFPGKSPGYDALAFAIDECHKRGMELHAWIVTIPVGKWNGLGCITLRKKFGNLIKKIGIDGYMNPEDARTGDYLAKICAEITQNYDIDGIHLDYIRYPEDWKLKVNKEQGRAYITSIVSKINKAVKPVKPWIKISCSPIGKYNDLPRNWAHGWNAYERVCQDAQGWLRDGLMDELFPMMYFKGNNFYPFAIDWKENDNGRIIAPGLGIYFLSPKEKNWPIEEITREMQVIRQLGMGHTFFRGKFFTDNTKGIYEYTKNFNAYPALVPAMTWEKKVPTDTLYNIYASKQYPVNTADARNLVIGRIPKKELNHYLQKVSSYHYAITRMDRFGNETPWIEKKSYAIEAQQKLDIVKRKIFNIF